MWDVKACRSCLSTTGKLERISEPNRRIYNAVTGLDFSQGDGYPKYFCTECIWQIKKILSFRRKSRRAFFVLKEIMTVKKQVTTNDVKIVDRVKTNLVSPYEMWKPNNTGVYTIITPDAIEVDDSSEPNNQNGPIEAENVNQDQYDINFKTKYDVKDGPIEAENVNQDQYNINFKTKYDVNKSDVSYELEITPKNESDNIPKNESEPKIKPGDLTKEEPEIINSSQVVTNIKPANYKELDEIEERENAINETADDFISDDVLNAHEELKIDLDDVFKDFIDDVDDESEKESVVEAPPMIPVKKERAKNMGFIKPMSHLIRFTAQALDSCDIRLLSENEQLQQFQQRMVVEPFKSALYKCALCLSILENMKKLLEHVNLHNQSANYKHTCNICKCRFETKYLLNQHGSRTHWYEYTCKLCKQKRYTIAEVEECYNKHGRRRSYIENAEKIPFEKFFTKSAQTQEMMKDSMQCYTYTSTHAHFPCKTCHLAFKDALQLAKHERLHYPRADGKQTYVCDNCDTHFIGHLALERHMERWHLYVYTCTKCHEVLRNMYQAKQHQKAHTVHQCEFCPANYKLFNSYENHMDTKHKQEAYIHNCNQCGVRYFTAIRLYRHQLDRHGYISIKDALPGDPQYKCEPCNVQFVNRKSYETHLVLFGHEEAENVELACTKCRKIFDTAEAHEEHLNSNCKLILKYPKKCMYCEAVLQNKFEYTHHYTKMHPGLNYVHARHCTLCEQCGKTIGRKRISEHMKLHADGDTDFHQCQYCNARLLNHKQHVLHIVTNHTRSPFHCALCPSKFRFRPHCRDHILRVHVPVMPYQCKFCSRRFALLEYLSEHSKRAHSANVDLNEYKSKRKLIGRFYLYPMMKVDVSLVQREVLDKVDLELSDFLSENIQKVTDPTDFYIFDSNQEPLTGQPEETVKRRKRRTEYEDDEVIVNKITKNAPDIVKKNKRNIKKEIEALRREMFEESNVYKEDRKTNVKTKRNKMKIEESYTDFGENSMKYEGVSVKSTNSDTVELDYSKIIGEDDFEVGDNYEVTEDNGEQYVTINGIVYKIEPQ